MLTRAEEVRCTELQAAQKAVLSAWASKLLYAFKFTPSAEKKESDKAMGRKRKTDRERDSERESILYSSN